MALPKLLNTLRRVVTHDEVTKRTRVVENTFLGRATAPSDAKLIESVALAIEALSDVNEAVLDLGSMILIKATDGPGSGKVFVKRLTLDQRAWLDGVTVSESPASLMAKLGVTEVLPERIAELRDEGSFGRDL